MRIEHDPDADAVYIYLTDAELAPGRDTVTADSPEGADGDVLLDWKAGRLVGIEVLGAGALLPPGPPREGRTTGAGRRS